VIQRPQTIYLLIAALTNFAVFFTPIYSESMNDPVQWIGFGLATTLTLTMILSIVAIFLFKNRMLQLKVVKGATYSQIVALGSATGVVFSMGGIGAFLWPELLSILLIVLCLVFLWMAGKNIKKDEELVQSMDRIR
jgi:4-hydroxybenzoate polyprenyltransferase